MCIRDRSPPPTRHALALATYEAESQTKQREGAAGDKNNTHGDDDKGVAE